MTVHIIPCGRSILDGLRDPAKKPGPRTGERVKADGSVKELRLAVQRMRECDTAEVLKEWREAMEAGPRGKLRLHQWKTTVCAESATLAARAGSELRDEVLLPDGDSAVLLASDTDDGLLSALLAATRITGGDTDRVHYTATSGADQAAERDRDLPGSSAGTVTVVLITRLGPPIHEGLSVAVRGIGDVMRAVYERDTGDIDVHLTGGYKATLLHTLALTEVLHSRVLQETRDRHVTACYLYEDAGADAGHEALTPIGLRAFQPDTLREMRCELTAVDNRNSASTKLFEGLAWEQQPDRPPRLTDFGHGYLAVLGREGGGSGSHDRGHVG